MERQVKMHPVFLKFSDEAVERRYELFRMKSTFIKMDYGFLYLNLILMTFWALSEFAIEHNFNSKVLLSCSLILQFLQCWIMFSFPIENWLNDRNRYVVTFRIIKVIICMFGIPIWLRSTDLGLISFWKLLIIGSGSLINLWYTCGMPLLFKDHVLVNLTTAALMSCVPFIKICNVSFESYINKNMISSLYKNIDDVLTLMLPNVPINATEIISSEHTSSIFSLWECYQLLSFVHLAISFTLPCYLVWKMEITSRKNFFKIFYVNNNFNENVNLSLDLSNIPDTFYVGLLSCASIVSFWLLLRI